MRKIGLLPKLFVILNAFFNLGMGNKEVALFLKEYIAN